MIVMTAATISMTLLIFMALIHNLVLFIRVSHFEREAIMFKSMWMDSVNKSKQDDSLCSNKHLSGVVLHSSDRWYRIYSLIRLFAVLALSFVIFLS